jgi:hypothetical protein
MKPKEGLLISPAVDEKDLYYYLEEEVLYSIIRRQ